MDHQPGSRLMSRRRLWVGNAMKAKIDKLKSSGHSLEWITAEAVRLGVSASSIGPERGLLPGAPKFHQPHPFDISHSKGDGEAVNRVAQAQEVAEEDALRCILAAGLDILQQRPDEPSG